MSAYIQGIKDILMSIKNRLDSHENEIINILSDVANGKLHMTETISAKEAKNIQALSGWVANTRPINVLAMAQSLLEQPGTIRGDNIIEVIYNDPRFAANPPPLGETISSLSLARLTILLVSYIFYEEFHYPQPETGMYNISGNSFQKLKWLYRYWFNQLETAEKNSEIEEILSSQTLNLPYDKKNNSTSSVCISCAGDLLAVDILTPENTTHLFDEIKDFYSNADIVSANLESTVDESKDLGRTQDFGKPAKMNTSKAMFHKFRDEAKINYFSTATNHAMDWGVSGVDETLAILKNSGADYSGTTKSNAKEGKERDGFTIIEKNGIKIAMLAYTFDLNGYEEDIPDEMPYLVNVIRFNDTNPKPDYSLIKQQVVAAKVKGADWIIAYCHWGWEFEMYPHKNIREAANKVVKCGVDTIIGNHAHVSQPAELIPRKNKQDALVVYALGDFVSYHPESRNSKLAYTIKFDIKKNSDEEKGCYLANLQTLPIYLINAQREEGGYDCRIVKFDNVIKNPDKYNLSKLEISQLPHLKNNVWNGILAPLSRLSRY
ncbi:CapA family protein [Halomonas halocynthiae]|uniref:CapA family protein n=1 Tax=Halomonas halocynthiae TaxID=176290 RepID=UPI0003F665EE|nr:CapA family protein [Halomonas halocynthiae]